MENPEIIINALTNEIASLKCQHRDELERVRMERRAADISMKDQLSALNAFVFDNKHQGSAVIEMLESFTYAITSDLKRSREVIREAGHIGTPILAAHEDIARLQGIKLLAQQHLDTAEEEDRKIIEDIMSITY